MRKPVKVLLQNSYSFEDIRENWKNKINPSHYLMGIIELEKEYNYKIDILRHEKYKWLNKLGEIIKIPYLDQQVRTIFKAKNYDIIYLPYPLANSRLLCYFKMFGLLRKPIVVLVHQNFFNKKNTTKPLRTLASLRYKQFSAFAFFSENLKKKFITELDWPEKVTNTSFFNVTWGPDLSFYQTMIKNDQGNPPSSYGVCAGTLQRDYDMLIQVFNKLNFNLKIFCTPQTIPSSTIVNSNIEIDTTWVPYTSLLNAYKHSKFIIIPLIDSIKNDGNTYGLTVLLDALAMGKPVIMTYHPYIDIDIEKENIGVWVKSNSPEEWYEKLTYLIELPDAELVRMQENAKKIRETSVNINRFAADLDHIFKLVLT